MPRTALMEQKAYDAGDLDLPVVCPAGERIGECHEGPAVRCRLEQSTISAARDGSTLRVFCMGEHEVCPTWRDAREMEWAHQHVEDLIAPDGLERSFDMDDLIEIDERRAAGDLEGVKERAAAIRAAHMRQARESVGT